MSTDASTASWQQAVVRSRIRSNRLILTYADGGYAPFIQNFAVGLLALRIRAPRSRRPSPPVTSILRSPRAKGVHRQGVGPLAALGRRRAPREL